MSYVLLAAKRIFRKETDSIRTRPMVVGNFSNGPGACCTNLHLISLRHATFRIFFLSTRLGVANCQSQISRNVLRRMFFIRRICIFYQYMLHAYAFLIKKSTILFKNLYEYLVAALKRINRRIKECKRVKRYWCKRADIYNYLYTYVYFYNAKSRDG